MQLVKLLNSKEVIEKLGNTPGLKSVIAYKVAKNIKAINEELETFDKARLKTIEKYADKDAEGSTIIEDGKYKMSEEAAIEANHELVELQQVEIDLKFEIIPIEEIEKAELTPLEIMAIEFMLEVNYG